MKLKIYIPVLITAALSVLSGCYTVVEHPDVQAKDENGYTYNSKVYFYDDCASCHTDKEHQRDMIPSEHLSMFKAHDDTAYENGSYQEDGYYSEQYYYPTQYYGDYGYYYNTPWWYTVTPPAEVTKTRNNNNGDRQAIQYNGRSRNQEGGRSTESRNSDNSSRPPSVSTNSGGSGSSGSATSSTSVQSGNNTNQNRGETRSTSENRNSNDQPKSRNSEGGRSSNSGRR